MTASVAPARDIEQCISGLLSITMRLKLQLGVAVTYSPLPEDLGTWDATTRTLTVDKDADLEDQTWLFLQVWQLLTMGRSAIDAAAIREPRLALVPIPRESLSNLA